jgi:hypothetical protein
MHSASAGGKAARSVLAARSTPRAWPTIARIAANLNESYQGHTGDGRGREIDLRASLRPANSAQFHGAKIILDRSANLP